MSSFISADRLRFLLTRFRAQLWVKPLAVCLLSIAAVFIAKLVDSPSLEEKLPTITVSSLETLLDIMAASMLVIATFSLGSMVSAYASASSIATPRSFTLVIADDASQNALSTFVGAFIFSIVAITAVKNEFFTTAGLFILFILTVFAFALVIFTFVRWVDSIARLGRLGSTIDKVEEATMAALKRRGAAPFLGALPVTLPIQGQALFATKVGYVQHIDLAALQAWAEDVQGMVTVAALPGTFAAPGRAIAYISVDQGESKEIDCARIMSSFQIGDTRLFADDPRFGLVVLSEIAGRALSPAVNDPGTAIQIIGTLIRLFTLWNRQSINEEKDKPTYDRVELPKLAIQDMFDDAFTAIARDGAGTVEVAVRLQKGLNSLATAGDSELREAAQNHAQLALKRAQIALVLAEDLAVVRDAATLLE